MAAVTTASSGSVGVTEKFFHYFQHEVTALQRQMDRLGDTALAGGERIDATDHCLAGISRLSTEVKDASIHIPAHDQRIYSEAIKALTERLQEVRATFASKSKFSFKTTFAQKNASAVSISDAAQLAAQQRSSVPTGYHLGSETPSTVASSIAPTPQTLRSPPTELEVATDDASVARRYSTKDSVEETAVRWKNGERNESCAAQVNTVNISGLAAVHTVLPFSDAHAFAPGSISNLHRCVVDMSVATSTEKSLASLTVKDVMDSLVVCGRLAGPVHVTNLTNTTVVTACRQFRMHDCSNCHVYLHSTSHPIVENCTGIRFAPLPEFYVGEPERHVENQWDHVDDFNWLKAEPSPNWKTLTVAERINDSTWADVISGRTRCSLEDILAAVGIPKAKDCVAVGIKPVTVCLAVNLCSYTRVLASKHRSYW